MRVLVRQLEQGLARLSDGLAFLSVISLFVLIGVVTLGVVMRYGFNNALTWSDELASYNLLALVFFGLAHTLRAEGHIRIDFIFTRLPRAVRPYVELVIYGVGVLFAAFMVLGTYTRVANFWVRNTHSFTDLYTPLYLPAIPLLIGSIMLFLMLFVQMLLLVLGMEERQ